MSAGEGEALTCRELIDLLADYLDSTLSQAAVVELEDHRERQSGGCPELTVS